MVSSKRVAVGERIYAIGDIHGRLDLLEALLAAIRLDSSSRSNAVTRIVVLGDFIDRGSQSAEIVAKLVRYSAATDRCVVLKGNHEQVMVRSLEGDFASLAAWLDVGGDATLRSWGVPDDLIREAPPSEIVNMARQKVTPDVLGWMDRLPLYHRSGDVLFVHAGVRPGVALAKQDPNDLLWIGEDFLEDDSAHPFFVVHGHSSNDNGPDLRPNRIGIDTAAYRSGRLTAVGLENGEHWILST